MKYDFVLFAHRIGSCFAPVFKLLLCWLLCTLAPIHAAQAPQTAATSTPVVTSTMPIYLYQSPLTAAFFKSNGAEYTTLLARWREYLKQYGPALRQINRRDLLAGLKPGILVLGSAVLLDDQERSAIDAYANAGGNVVLSWGTGARNGKGTWAGYAFLEQLMEVKVLGTLDRQQDQWFLNPFGDSPLSYTVPAGKRIYLGRTAETPLRLESRHLAARYLDWSRQPSNDNGAIAFTEKNGSRRVMLGFSESSWEYDQDNDIVPILDAAFEWLKHEIQVYPATWPQGYLAAQLLEMDTEDKFSNAEVFASDLSKIQVKGTFYCLTSIGKDYPKLLNQLAANHEVGFHGDVHIGFRGKTPAEQEQRIKTMKKQLSEVMAPEYANKIVGFRAPTESSDETTEKLLRQNGLRYYVSQPESADARLPFFSSAEQELGPEQALVVLPRTQNDDINFAKLKKHPEQISDLLTRELNSVLEMGALGILSVHSQNYSNAGLLTKTGFMRKLMPSYLESLKQHRAELWITTGVEISEWWRAKTRVIENSSPNQLAFQVAAPGVPQNLSFFITHPRTDSPSPELQAIAPGLPMPQIKRIDAFRSAVIFNPLPAGKYSYQIHFHGQKK